MSVVTTKKTNKKLMVSIVVLVLVSIASIAGIVTVLALTQRNIDSAIFIRFTAIDIDGEVEASYRVGNVATWTSMSGTTPHRFNAEDNETNTQMNPGDIKLTSTNNFVEFRYVFRNFGDADYTGLLTLDEVVTENNMEIWYKYNDEDYTTSSYGLVVEGVDTADSGKIQTRDGEKYTEMTYYIKVEVKELSKSASYSSDFFWLLERYDGEVTGEVVPLATSTYVANGDGTYSASYNGSNISVAGTSTGSNGISNVWIVPNNLGSAPVTKVVKGNDLPANTKVVIGDNVTILDDFLFLGSTGLVDIVIGNGMTLIPDEVFSYCLNLRIATIGSKVESIGYAAFYGCTSLTAIKISNSVTSIGISAFSGCSGLTSIEIPSSVTNIGNSAFAFCSNLISVQIPDNITSIETSLFDSCSSLTSIEIPNTVTSIGTYAFGYCVELKEITIPSSVTSIGNFAFSDCSGLTKIEVDKNNTAYASEGNCLLNKAKTELIKGCNTSVIPSTVINIGNSAFSNCSGLTSVQIPDSVTSIGKSAFYRCSSLTSVEFKNPNGWWYADSSSATSGTSFSVSATDFGANATLLTSTYRSKYWKRG